MRIPEVLRSFHGMPPCDRLDLLSRMLRHCFPYELRFLGTVACDASREHFENLSQLEQSANHVNHFSGFKDAGLTHEVCEKLCCALALVRADNRPVGETVFNLLDDPMVLKVFEETADMRVLEDYRLLYVMAVNHPALPFSRRLHLLFAYLQPLDQSFSEKRKHTFSSGSFSSGSGETWGKSTEIDVKHSVESTPMPEPAQDAYITRCEVHSVFKRPADRRYVYMMAVEWSDGTHCNVHRTYGDFFSFQNKLLDLFPKEGGSKSRRQRVIPFLPGKKWIGKSNRELAERRLPELAKYSRELVSLSEHIAHSTHVLEFFRPHPQDSTFEYPPHRKVTTLEDVVASRTKHPSAPPSLRSNHSPAHSPIPLRTSDSPIRRLGLVADTPPSPPNQTRSSQTLPLTQQQQVKTEEGVSPLLRRPTWPSVKSAFTAVSQSPATPTSVGSTTDGPSSVSGSTGSLVAGGSQLRPLVVISQQPASSEGGSTIEIAVSGSLSHTPSPPTTSSSTLRPVGAGESSTAITAQTAVQRDHVTQPPGPAHLQTTGLHAPSTGDGQSWSGASTCMVSLGVGVASSSYAIVEAIASPPAGPGLFPSPHSTLAGSGLLPSPHSTVQASHGLHHDVTTVTASLPAPGPASPSPPLSGTSTPKDAHPYSPSLNQIVAYNIGLQSRFLGAVSPVSPFSQYMYGSPLPTHKHGYGSSNCIVIPTEYDSLVKWLKAHRLHKYASLFEGFTFEELCSLNEEELKGRGMTAGAAHKLRLKLDEFRGTNFSGFRDMPSSTGISRKPSTCSLPAAILMERGATPTSSIEALSPTESTCSLDKAAPLRSSSAVATDRHARSKSDGFGAEMSAPLVDSAIVRAVPLGSRVTNEDVGSGCESPLGGHAAAAGTTKSAHRHSAPLTAPIGHTSSFQDQRLRPHSYGNASVVRVEGRGSGSSWADSEVLGEAANQPAWAQLSSPGTIKPMLGTTRALPGETRPAGAGPRLHPRRGGPPASTLSPGHTFPLPLPTPTTAHLVRMQTPPKAIQHIGTSLQPHPSHPHTALPSHPHTTTLPSHPHTTTSHPHTTLTPSHPHTTLTPSQAQPTENGHVSNGPAQITMPMGIPPGLMSLGGGVGSLAANGWLGAQLPRPFLVPTSLPLVKSSQSSPVAPGYHPSSVPFNGMAGGEGVAPFVGGGGVASCGAHSTTQLMCCNCGKKGHHGNTCPADTMESNSAESFHRKVEGLHVSQSRRSPLSAAAARLH